MKKVVFVVIFMLGFAWNCHAQTWSYVQDSNLTYCSNYVGSSSCNISGPGNIAPTTAGSIWIVAVQTANNATITSVTGGGATWHLCPSSSCHLFNSAMPESQDLAYGFGGTAGTTSGITINISASAQTYFGAQFIEILPPAGSTAAIDAAGTLIASNCTTCTAVGLTLSATDAVVQVMAGQNAASWNSWSAPYLTDVANDGIALNIANGAAPTVTVPSSSGVNFSAVAFKSSLGSFTPPPSGPMSLVNFTSQIISCGPTCTLTLPNTIGSGHLLYLEAAGLFGTYISSVSGGGTWLIPSGGNSCRIALSSNNTSNTLSCAYVLSSTAGSASITVTMTGNASIGFTLSEIAATSGSFTLDTQGSTQNAPSYNPSGQALTLNGTNYDAVFQSSFIPGGSSGVSWYPLTNGYYFLTNEAQQVELLNVKATNAPVPVWVNEQNNPTTVTGIAFMVAGGTATAPNPPTGLTAVVH